MTCGGVFFSSISYEEIYKLLKNKTNKQTAFWQHSYCTVVFVLLRVVKASLAVLYISLVRFS